MQEQTRERSRSPARFAASADHAVPQVKQPPVQVSLAPCATAQPVPAAAPNADGTTVVASQPQQVLQVVAPQALPMQSVPGQQVFQVQPVQFATPSNGSTQPVAYQMPVLAQQPQQLQQPQLVAYAVPASAIDPAQQAAAQQAQQALLQQAVYQQALQQAALQQQLYSQLVYQQLAQQPATQSSASSSVLPSGLAGGQEMPGVTDQRFESKIVMINKERSFGFIACPPDLGEKVSNKDIFMHKTEVADFNIGDVVSFMVRLHRDGRPQARELTLVASAASMATVAPLLPPLSLAPNLTTPLLTPMFLTAPAAGVPATALPTAVAPQ
mmetsp:Transcript_18151/g.42168  ORF Transcript_18151/g.42168 Transcript_18151/m.42168 type:complete len:326 (+) Transcript_18151:123-1100(+)